ncbi:putative membrane protein [Nocardia transvalensis]|uniref:Putative membrane protein n=1 Tax=Nocardia transvalensis TaxID=37333 RepID=A0A7W9PA68_9NOCA|nr:SHOCT domain-containing protein [Nocardia transvalensis]MBB5912023.1 putative membrane protein [Nocardia transvalensis]
MTFWDVFWLIIMSFFFICYLMVLFSIFADLFRDRETSGVVKAIWVVTLLIFPFITALIYLVVRGGNMAERHVEATYRNQAMAQEAYLRDATTTTPATQIATAKKLLDEGTITEDEFERIKGHAIV